MPANQHISSVVKLDEFIISDKFLFNDVMASYTLYGELNNGKKLALFFHGFSGNSDLNVWWKKFPLQNIENQYNIICFNSLGSCHGSLGPETISPHTGLPYEKNFPQISIADTIDFIRAALRKMNIQKLDLVFGCSMGGMQALDMFIRYPEMADKFISVCGSPLPYTTKLMNAAQSNIVENGINNNISKKDLRSRMGLARFFFRLSCTTENALLMLHNNKTKEPNLEERQTLEEYFISDSIKYETSFSPYSYNLYLRMLINFELEIPENINNLLYQNKEIFLVSIIDDQFAPPECIENIYNLLTEKKINVRKGLFYTNYGHEAWILDGERFYEFIKNELIT